MDDVDRGGEERRVAAYAGGMAQGDAQVGLAQTDAAEKDGVGFLLNEVQAEEVLDLRPVDLLRPVPLELIQGFGEGEARAADTLSEGLVLAPGDLTFDQVVQVIRRSRPLFDGGLRQLMIVGADKRELQAQQQFIQRVAYSAQNDHRFQHSYSAHPIPGSSHSRRLVVSCNRQPSAVSFIAKHLGSDSSRLHPADGGVMRKP